MCGRTRAGTSGHLALAVAACWRMSLADEPGDVVVRHPRRTMIPHGVEHRGRRFRAGVEHRGVAAEVLGRLAGDGQAPGFGAFPEQVRGEVPGVDVGEVQGEHLGVAGSAVRVPGSGAASSAVTASVVMYFTGAAAGPLSRGMAARSAR